MHFPSSLWTSRVVIPRSVMWVDRVETNMQALVSTLRLLAPWSTRRVIQRLHPSCRLHILWPVARSLQRWPLPPSTSWQSWPSFSGLERSSYSVPSYHPTLMLSPNTLWACEPSTSHTSRRYPYHTRTTYGPWMSFLSCRLPLGWPISLGGPPTWRHLACVLLPPKTAYLLVSCSFPISP